jgi:hypothetical protein
MEQSLVVPRLAVTPGLIRALPKPGEWSIGDGVIPRGPVSIASYTSIVAEHDIEHRRQIQITETRAPIGT